MSEDTSDGFADQPLVSLEERVQIALAGELSHAEAHGVPREK